MAGLLTLLATSGGTPPVDRLPSLPRPIAGQFVGAIGNTIVVAGGSWWQQEVRSGAVKAWENKVLALAPGEDRWQVVAELPQPLAYGGSASLGNKMILAGGQDGSAFSLRVWALTRRKGSYKLIEWPPLPHPLANFSMAFAGGHIYIFGGQESPDSLAGSELWSLAVDANGDPVGGWVEGPSLPGEGRILAAAAGCNRKFYIVSGATLVKSADGSLVRHYLQDAWSYAPATGWKQLPNLPRAAAAAPAACDSAGLLIMGGDDRHVAGGKSNSDARYPGFSRSVLRFDFATQQWSAAEELPSGLVTTGAAVLPNGRIVIPGGENHPGSRSSDVLQLRISN